MSDVTRVIEAIQQGDPKAAEELLPLVYEELRKLAASKMANEAAGNTLQPTALVHEAWLRLVGDQSPKFAGRAHFFAAAAEAMRRILVENARRNGRQKHGGGRRRDHPDLDALPGDESAEELLRANRGLAEARAEYSAGRIPDQFVDRCRIAERAFAAAARAELGGTALEWPGWASHLRRSNRRSASPLPEPAPSWCAWKMN